ncbi:MAG: hypothetical protein ACOYMN_03635 [Roseimicrobium sp.]
MKRFLRPALFLLAVLLSLLLGVWLGGGRDADALWRQFTSFATRLGQGKAAPDAALLADLPVADPLAGLPPSPLNMLLKPDLTPQQQTEILGQMLLDYWAATHSLPNGTWEETCAQLSGANSKKLTLVPQGHPALGKDSFRPGKDASGIRLHVISSTGGAFQLIHDGPDKLPYTDDDLIRNFPPTLQFR